MNLKKLIDKYPTLLLGVILIIGFLVYFPSTEFKFLMNFDDDILLLSGLETQAFSLENLKQIFTNSKYGLYHPLTSLTWNIEHSLFGADPFYYHLDNIILHLINVSLVFVLVSRFLKDKAIGLFSALLFAIHPMHVENIVWLSSRKDLVYGLFFLLSLISYHRFTEEKSKAAYALAIFFFILSLLSKANAIVLPAIFILFDWYKGRTDWMNMVLRKLPWFVISGLMVYITIQTQQAEGFIREIDETFNLLDRFFLLSFSLFHYFFHVIAPIDLSPKNFYPIKDGSLLPMLYYSSFLFIVFLGYLILKSKYKKELLFAFLFALIILLPVLKLIPTGNDLVSNRYAYIPYIMLYAVIGYILSKSKIKWLKLIPIVLIPFFIFQSFQYKNTYKDSNSIWTTVVETAKDNPSMKAMALNERGQVYFKSKNNSAALNDINQALKIEPTLLRGLINRANIYDLNNQFDLAIQDLNVALENHPESVEGLKIRGVILSKQNKAAEAILDFNSALEITPERADLYNNRAIAYSILENTEEALKDFAKAIELDKDYIDAYANRANLYIKLNQPTKAQQDLAVAYSVNTNNFIYAYLIAKTHLMNGKPEKAKAFLAPYAKEAAMAAEVAQRLSSDGYLKESLPYYQIAIGNESIKEKSYYQRAQVFKNLGEYQNAIDDLMVIIEKMPGGQFFFEIANLYQLLENKEKACEFWNEGAIRDHKGSKVMQEKFCA